MDNESTKILTNGYHKAALDSLVRAGRIQESIILFQYQLEGFSSNLNLVLIEKLEAARNKHIKNFIDHWNDYQSTSNQPATEVAPTGDSALAPAS